MQAWETIHCYVTAPGGTETQATPFTGDSLTVRKSPSLHAQLIAAWDFNNNGNGRTRIFGQSFHDSVYGIEYYSPANSSFGFPVLSSLYPRLVGGETIRVTKTGSAVGGDQEITALQIYYPELEGLSTNFIDVGELNMRVVNTFALSYALTLAAAPGLSPLVALSSPTPNGINPFKADRNYAILGGASQTVTPDIMIQGPCTGSMRYGYPRIGTMFDELGFLRLTRQAQLPAIPVMKGLDAQNTYIMTAYDSASSASATLFFAELNP